MLKMSLSSVVGLFRQSCYLRSAFSSQSSVKNATDFLRLRQIKEQALEKTKDVLDDPDVELSIICPYGFELNCKTADDISGTPSWPLKAQRHYPALGIVGAKGRQETIANIFMGILLNLLNEKYANFYQHLAVVLLHGFGHYINIRHGKMPKDLINIISVQVIILPEPGMQILDHYAKYIATLFAVLMELGAADLKRHFSIPF